MSLEEDILALSRIELFSGFSAEHLRLIAFGSEKLDFPADTQIFYHDQPADGGYLVQEGGVELWVEKHGERVVLQTFGPGDLIGELALLTRLRRTGSATTTAETRLVRISRATMTRVLEEYPHLAALIHDRIAEDVTGLTRELSQVEQKLNSGTASQ